MRTSADGRAAIVAREGLVLTAYRDSAGILTIGVGHTSVAGPPKVTAGMTITAKEADEILTRDLVSFEKAVNNAVKVPLNQNEFDALVSLAFNIGTGAFSGSTLVRKLNAGDKAGAADQFFVWNKVTQNGKKVTLKGLVNRREAERKQFLTPVKASAGETVIIERPVVADPGELEQNPATSKTVWTWALTAVGAPVAALGGLDWRVQLAIVAVIVGFAIYGIKRRVDLYQAVKKLHQEFG